MNRAINFDDMEYAAPLRQFDLRTAPDRLDAWCTALERRIEALEADNAALRERVAQLEPKAPRLRSDAATAIAAFLRKQGVNGHAAQRDQLQIATPNAVAETLRSNGYGDYTASEIADAMATWNEVET